MGMRRGSALMYVWATFNTSRAHLIISLKGLGMYFYHFMMPPGRIGGGTVRASVVGFSLIFVWVSQICGRPGADLVPVPV
jgi:hypothetical protein